MMITKLDARFDTASHVPALAAISVTFAYMRVLG